MLLLDDIFDKLDEDRTRKLMQMVSDNDFGQVFITDTSAARIKGIFNGLGIAISLFNVNKGEVVHGQD